MTLAAQTEMLARDGMNSTISMAVDKGTPQAKRQKVWSILPISMQRRHQDTETVTLRSQDPRPYKPTRHFWDKI